MLRHLTNTSQRQGRVGKQYARLASLWPRVTALLFATALGSLPLAAQLLDPSLKTHSPQIKVNVREVVVDVTVYDSRGYLTRGEPIGGLTKDDFEILEGGKPQQIRTFDDHHAALSVTNAPTQTTAERETDPHARPGLTVILVDQASLGFDLQPWVLNQIESFLNSAPPGSQIALFALSPRLRVVHTFTANHAELLTAMRSKGLGIHPLPSPYIDSQDALDSAKQAPAALRAAAAEHGGSGGQLAAQLDRMQEVMAATEAMQRTNNTLKAFQQIARYLAGFPGRKSLIWLASTFTDRPFGIDTEPDPEFRFTADMLDASRVAVYPIDGNGLAAPNGPHAAAVLPGITSGEEATAALNNARTEESLDRNRTQWTMDEVASRTGGQAFFNTNGLAWAMNRVVEETSRYYTLVYTSTAPADAPDYTRIVVSLKGHRGVYRLSYKPGYFTKEARALKENSVDNIALDPYMDPSMPTLSQIHLGITSRPVVRDETARLKLAGGNRKLQGALQRVEVTFAIPFHDLNFTSDETALQHGAFLLDLGAYNEKGELVNNSTVRYSPSLSTEAVKRTEDRGLHLSQQLDLPPGKYLLRSGVYDLHTSRVGTVDTPLTVTPPKDQHLP